MKNLFKNIIKYWRTAILLVVLLFLQAACDMSLPGYTQNIIDTGIQNYGITHMLPSKMTEQDYKYTMSFLSQEEDKKWQSIYTATNEDGKTYYELKDMNQEEMSSLDSKFMKSLAMASIGKSGAAGEEYLKTLGDDTIMSMAKTYTYKCEKAAGVNVEGNQMSYLWREGLMMLGMALLMTVLGIIISFISSRTGAKIGKTLRNDIFHKVMTFSNAEMNNFHTSSLITRATNDVQQVQMVSILLMRMVLYAPIVGAWGIIKVVETRAKMNWVIVLGVCAIVAFIMILFVLAMPKFRRIQKLIDNLNGVSREILTGLLVIRAFGRQAEEQKRFDAANTELMRTQLFTNRVMTFMQPGMTLLMNGLVVLITWVAAGHIDMGDMQVGEMTAFITYTMMIVSSFLMLTMMSIMLPRAGVAADRIAEVLDTDSSVVNLPDATDKVVERGLVEFRDVYFSYPDADEDVLHGISFTAKPGETTAIIGGTGTGKSTLVKLIPRFYDVTGGSILVDGTDVRDYKLRNLREAIGYVPQKGSLFSGTIASNLRFGAPEATEEQLENAADTAQALQFIQEKENGFDSSISQNGGNVSGGQRQRLSIARALIKNPKILIFDDSFSALDMKTDAELRRALATKEKDATKIIVAQRVGTILNAEQILVLDEGRIIGKGTHEELMNSCDVYRQIAESQLSKSELGGV